MIPFLNYDFLLNEQHCSIVSLSTYIVLKHKHPSNFHYSKKGLYLPKIYFTLNK